MKSKEAISAVLCLAEEELHEKLRKDDLQGVAYLLGQIEILRWVLEEE